MSVVDSAGGSDRIRANGISSTATNITGISGDVIGTDISGTGNIIGKELTYIEANVLNIQVNGISAEILQNIKDVLSRPVQLETKADLGQQPHNINTEFTDAKANEARVTKETTEQVLSDIDQIGKEKGVRIDQIKVEELQVSRTELQIKDIISEGNEYYYRGEYRKAMQCYDRALELDEKYAAAWINKGNTLGDLGRYDEAIQCYDRALELDDKNIHAWNNKGFALNELNQLADIL